MLKTQLAMTAALAMLLVACQPAEPARSPGSGSAPIADAAFVAETQAWRDRRKQDLLQPDGWTSLVGLHPIELKAHYIGAGPGSGIRLAAGPEKMGMLSRQGDRYFLMPERDSGLLLDEEPVKARIELRDDRDPAPTTLAFDEGKGKLNLIERGGRHYLRIRHEDAPTRIHMGALEYWPTDPAWRFEARFVANPAGTTLPIIDMIGVTTAVPSPGAVEFERNGASYRLDVLSAADGRMFIPLADRTSGQGSYSAGRYLEIDAPADGKVVLDFNRAHNPPSAFTLYATCPLPPAQNRLDLAVEAGEKAYRRIDSSSP
ncbi:DUF1684 domain-containing protein [Pseudoxanthomonas wuyuanensis]|uniref:DUF1684 domain-containing protein n=1 Tax=Pseudoxanthomonas wuyuanensis TaxID=1073196 RepID=A0A286D988_9GAMM|nr:DUF1684 domain-containing protein [Pseudoxanthomonas wuyuanensis]SOD55219.1 hypothetical protein SAMN06296416_106186 [Pseudoxanthomonas wuyuanensis]